MATLKTVLIADDEPSIRHVLTLVLAEHGYDVRAVGDGEEAHKELIARPYDVVISDVRMPKMDGILLLKAALTLQPDLTFLVMSAYGSKDQALEAVSLGAFDYIEKPFKPEEVVFVLKKAEERLKLVRENKRLKGNQLSSPLDSILGASEPILNLKKQMARVAKVSSTILIQGESGTGKELIAKALHQLSPRAAMPFVTVNCGAIPEGLIESELFGHAKGAFTDAKSAKRGLFSEADGGTLLLDEVGELPLGAQVKLLRFLQEGEIRPVGETKSEKADVRVIAATLRDLTKLVSKGLFREDLFFRLNVVPLKVPPLRDRQDDIELLAMHYIEFFNRTLNREDPIVGLSLEAKEFLRSYGWPGNVRELQHAIERAVLLNDANVLTVDSLPEKLWTQVSGEKPADAAIEDLSLKRAIPLLEEKFIRAALRKTKGNRTRAAELLELSHRALLYKLRDYGIDADSEGEKN
jgi:two-component system, NtrC family, response regulator AtoC